MREQISRSDFFRVVFAVCGGFGLASCGSGKKQNEMVLTDTPKQNVPATAIATKESSPVTSINTSAWSERYISLVPVDQKDMNFTFGTEWGVISLEKPYTLTLGDAMVKRFGDLFFDRSVYPVHPLVMEAGIKWSAVSPDFLDFQDDNQDDSTGHAQIIVQTNRGDGGLFVMGHTYRDGNMASLPLSLDWSRRAFDFVGGNREKLAGLTVYLSQESDGMVTLQQLSLVDARAMTGEKFGQATFYDGKDQKIKVNADVLGIPDAKKLMTFVGCARNSDGEQYGDRILFTFALSEISRYPVGTTYPTP